MTALTSQIIARVMGGEVTGPNRCNVPGPGHPPKDRSLTITLDPTVEDDGFIVHSFAGDDWIVCKDYVRQRLGLPQWKPGDGRDRRITPSSRTGAFDRTFVDAKATERRPHTEDDVIRISRAVRIWDESQDPRGSVAECYLNGRRLILTNDVAGNVLRFHPRCPWRDENTGQTIYLPALIAAFRSIDDDTITAVHRVALNADGSKIGRRMLGIVHRAAVKLGPAVGSVLHIGEGIETCMAAQQLGHSPAWALGSVGAISFFPVLDQIKTLLILGETGKASADAIQFCGRRWHRAGRRVRIVMPDVGSDLNDQLIMQKA